MFQKSYNTDELTDEMMESGMRA